MTVAQALDVIRRVGTVTEDGGKLKLAYPHRLRADLEPAIEALRANKLEALARLQSEEPRTAGEAAPDRGQQLDPATGIRPISAWGPECARGFVFNERFARPGDRVIQRTVRSRSRAQAVPARPENRWARAAKGAGDNR